jgi:uncharacterized membrane protein YczE
VPDLLRGSLPGRLSQLYVGLVTFAFGEALIVQARLGVMSWDVLHQGLARHLGLTIGQWSVIVGALVLLLWIPLRERPGLGTVSNVFVIGASLDVFLRWVPAPSSMGWRVAWLMTGILVNGIATALYIGARLGPGPRDGLMTGLVRRTRWPLGWVRTGIEVSVVFVGYLLGGNLNVGTVLFVVTIGPIVQVLLPRLTVGGPVLDR